MSRKHVAALCIAILSAVGASRADIYVSPEGAGNRDGTSEANAYDVTQLQQACAEAALASVKTVRLAGGVYYTLETSGVVVSNGVSLIGSADADNPTVLCGDVNKDDVWDRFSIDDYWKAATNGQSYARSATSTPVLKDGKINLPDDADSVMYFARFETRADNRKRCLYVQGATARSIENITITGYGIGWNSGTLYGCAVYVKNANTTFRNVKVIGNYPHEGGVITYGKSYFYNCEFSRNQVTSRGSYEAYAADDELYDCRFVSNYRESGSSGPAIYFWGSSSAIVSNCWFEMNECGSGFYSPSPCISIENATAKTRIMDCTFTNNLSVANVPSCINANNKAWRILNCRMVGNTTCCSGNATAAITGCVGAWGGGTVLDGCTLAANRTGYRSSGSAAKTVAAAPYLVYGKSTTETTAARGEAVNCLFYDNTFVLEGNTNNATLRVARGLGVYGQSTEANASIGVANCTFAGSAAFPDVVVFGARSGNEDSVVVNSVFSGPVPSAYRPLAVYGDQPVLFVSNTTAGVFSYDATVTTEGTRTDDPLVVLPRGEMSARTEGMRATCPVSWFETSNVRYYVYEYGGTACHLNAGFAAKTISASRTYIGDIAKTARPTDGTALRGARETTDAATAAKKTVIWRISPAGSATLNGKTGLTELSDGGQSSTVFTFVKSSDKIVFEAWKDTAGNVLSTDIDWKPTVGADDVTVVAVFAAPKIKYTFNLGLSGTFDANGKSTITVEYTTGDVPSVPAYTFDSEHYVEGGWDRELPLAVGTDDLTFNMIYYERKYRILRFDANVAPGGTGDGSTWANAMTNFADAVELVNISGGEIRIKMGEQRPCKTTATSFAPASGASILGGFDGKTYASDAAELAARDWTNNVTTISGYLPGKTTKATRFLNLYDATADETCVIDGCSFENFSPSWAEDDGVLLLGSHAHPTVRNCTFTGVNCGANCRSWAFFENCRFLSCTYGVYTATLGPWTQRAQFTDCLFEGCSSDRRGPLAVQGGETDVRRCTFRRNTSTGNGYGAAASIGAENGTAWVWDSLFEDNVSTVNGGGIVVGTRVFSNCVVRANRAANGTVFHMKHYMHMTDSSFYGNVASVSSTATSGTVGGAIVSFGIYGASILNTTFDENVVTGSTAGAATAFGTLYVSGWGYGSVAHATFRNNVADADIVENVRTVSNPLYFVSDVAWSDASGYSAYLLAGAPTGSGRTHVYDSTFGGLTTTPSSFATVKGLKTDNPKYVSRLYDDDGHVRVRVSASSSAARTGRDYYSTANGAYTFNSADKGATEVWVTALGEGTITKPYTRVPDATGAARREGKVTRGAIEAKRAGFVTVYF